MSVFNQYAKFYDSIYGEKDYPGEVDYLERLFQKFSMQPVSTILDLGCGSGGHTTLLAERGYRVTGVDQSSAMLAAARTKTNADNPEYIHSDLLNIDLGKKFDAVISMFAVFSYITENADLLRAFQVISQHLQPGGLFFFDAWFGPAVLSERPADRFKIVMNGNDRIIRFARPKMDVLAQTVTVDYKVLQLSGNRIVEEVDESHQMRFFFACEVEQFLTGCGFRLLTMHSFLDEGRPLSEHDWNMAVLARKEE